MQAVVTYHLSPEGEWSYQDDSVSINVNIIDFVPEEKVLRLEYYYEEIRKCTFSSNGVIDLGISFRDNKDLFYSNQINNITGNYYLSSQIELFLGKKASCKNGEGTGIVFEAYLLERQ